MEICAENMSFKLKLFGKQDRKGRGKEFRYHRVGWESWKAFEQGKKHNYSYVLGRLV